MAHAEAKCRAASLLREGGGVPCAKLHFDHIPRFFFLRPRRLLRKKEKIVANEQSEH